MTVLDDILAQKRSEVAALEQSRGFDALVHEAQLQSPARGFARALRSGPAPRVIAEFKRASPSKGEIRPGAEPADIAKRYEQNGAVALSVLTDEGFFQGRLSDLEQARAAVHLPVLRKDFTIAPIQIAEARAAGADAILLIVAALAPSQLSELSAAARELGVDPLVEVHTRAELDTALGLGIDLIGINNRDLKTFVTDVEVTRGLLPHRGGATIISESGLGDAETLRDLGAAGVDGFLIGESLMREPDPGAALAKLRGES